MPNFTPAGTIRIGSVPWDNSYKHTMTWPDAQAQSAGIGSMMRQNLSRSDYTYVKPNNSIRVPYNAENLYTCNYVMFQNANYGSKWFYSFIVECNYINENTTELVLDLDVMQTWYFDYTLSQCFVEREHSVTDQPGDNIVPEPSMDIQYIYNSIHSNYIPRYRYVVLMVNAYMQYNQSQDKARGSYPVSGGVYHNVYNACKYIIYDLDNPASVTSLKNDMEAFNGVGAAETIADAFMVPFDAFSSDELIPLEIKIGDVTAVRSNVYTMKEGTSPKSRYENISLPSLLDGYSPKNKKLLTFPFTLLEVGDFNGRTFEYRWEYSDSPFGMSIYYTMPITSALTTYIWPVRYNGIEYAGDKYSYPEPFTVDVSNKLSWVYSAYQNWAAQNALTNQLAIIGSVGAATFGAAAGITGAVGALSAASAAGSVVEGVIGQHSPYAAQAGYAQRNYAASMEDARRSAMGAGGAIAAGGAGLIGTLSQYDRMSRQPNTARGSICGNSKVAAGYSGWYIATKTVNAKCAEIIDGFFDMYGYQTDRVKVPNREGRKSWNFVKCANADHHGDVPASDMSRINAVYNSGITFWHTSDIGNYSLNNEIVGA